MKRSSKKGFLKTGEAFMAIVVIFTFIIFFMPQETRTVNDQSRFRLQHLEVDEEFRECVYDEDDDCIDGILDRVFEGRYEFQYVTYRFSEPDVDIDEDQVYVYSWYYGGTGDEFDPKVFKLFYWEVDRDVPGFG